VNDPVDKLLAERERLERGFSGGLVLSLAAHLVLVAGSLLAAMMPQRPLLDVADGIAVPLPPGGGGQPSAQPPAPAPKPEPAPPPPPQPPPPEPVKPAPIKPPKPEPKKGLPELDAKAPKKAKPTPTPAPARASGGGTGTSSDPVGIGIGPPGPGVPEGTDLFGDWYLAGVQRKIWLLWTQQIQPDYDQPVTVRFAILADGSVADVAVVQSSGISLIDRAAQRAVVSAAPFGPLPRSYGTNRYTVQAVFRPTR
jgi:protein TonB